MPVKTALEKAVELLAARPHFRRELAAKLAARGYAEEEAAAALDRLEGDGYLDDRRQAEDFVALRLERRNEGPGRLRAELERRGVEPGLAAEVVRRRAPEADEAAGAREAADAWRRRRRSPAGETAAENGALARHLARKGFSPRVIFTVLRDGRETEDWDPEP